VAQADGHAERRGLEDFDVDAAFASFTVEIHPQSIGIAVKGGQDTTAALPSLWMADEDHSAEPTQLTQPKGRDKDGKSYDPVEIPVPKRGDAMSFFRKLMRPGEPPKGESAPRGRLPLS
jgi:hypothetical protein